VDTNIPKGCRWHFQEEPRQLTINFDQ
jgi:hypothetical protein